MRCENTVFPVYLRKLCRNLGKYSSTARRLSIEKYWIKTSDLKKISFRNKYIFSKYLSEQVVNFFSKSVPSIIVRLSNIYGYTRLRRPDLIPTIMQDIFEKDKVSIWNDSPKRDFIFTEDAADAVLKLLDTDYTSTINLGTGKMTSLKEICKVIEKLSGKKILSENKKVTGPMEFVTDI